MSKQIACTFALFLVVLYGPAYGQRAKPRVKPKVEKPIAVKQTEPLPGYDFNINVSADGNMQLQVLTGYESPGLSNALLEKALTEYSEMTGAAPAKQISLPRVFIRPEPAVDMKRLIEIARSARVSGASTLQIVTPGDVSLMIGPEPREQDNINVKPNPLTLVVAIHKDQSLTLNNEKYGSISDPSALGTMLQKVFHEREASGVFREGSNEVEKTVNIRVELPARFSDLIAVAKSVRDAGAEPIFLIIDDNVLPNVDDRKELIPGQ